mmetsp:Transcript_35896/g.75487  ORF Transcript_35896/g.75487 Transcript_35896/m.75487 type:complete len:202 (-) Transcript_35896:108-713(-)
MVHLPPLPALPTHQRNPPYPFSFTVLTPAPSRPPMERSSAPASLPRPHGQPRIQVRQTRIKSVSYTSDSVNGASDSVSHASHSSSSSSEKTISSSDSSAAMAASRSRVFRIFSARRSLSSARRETICSGSSAIVLAFATMAVKKAPPSKSSAYCVVSRRSTSRILFTSVNLKVRSRSEVASISAREKRKRNMWPSSRNACT